MTKAAKRTVMKASSRRKKPESEHPASHELKPIEPTSNNLADAPTVDELRKARADFYSRAAEERAPTGGRNMVYISETRSIVGQSDPKPHARSGEEQHGTRRKHRSGRTHKHRTIDGTKAPSDVVYVYGNPESSTKLSSRKERGSSASVSRVASDGSQRRDSLGESRTRSRRKDDRRGSSRRDSGDILLEREEKDTSLPEEAGKDIIRRRKSRVHRSADTSSETEAPKIKRSASTRETSLLQSRPTLKRSHTTTRVYQPSPSQVSLRPSPPSRRPLSYATPSVSTIIEKKDEPANSLKSPTRGGVLAPFSALFGLGVPDLPEKKVECLTCLSDDIPLSKSAKLDCNHRMCHDCLRRIFTMSVTDPQHMPPRCCTQDHIPLKHVDRLFGPKFKLKWNKKYQEYNTKNRIYCPSRGCGHWIRPANIFLDTSGGASGGRKYGKCNRCKTKVCCLCNGKWHSGKDCPRDEETKKFIEIAKKEGWQKCHNCSAMVELKEGCNHMTCRCTAEFCIICGLKWKTCDCPWFNYDAIENDRLNHMRVPGEVPRPPLPPPPFNIPRNELNTGRNNQPPNYNDELALRRLQELRDEAYARRLQALGVDDDDDDHSPPNPRNNHNNRQNPHPNNNNNNNNFLPNHQPLNTPDFIRAAADLLTGPYGVAERNAERVIPRRPRAAAPAQNERGNSHLLPRRAVSYRGQRGILIDDNPSPPPPPLEQQQQQRRRRSDMAGLGGNRNGRGGRVGNWLAHVEDE